MCGVQLLFPLLLCTLNLYTMLIVLNKFNSIQFNTFSLLDLPLSVSGLRLRGSASALVLPHCRIAVNLHGFSPHRVKTWLSTLDTVNLS